MPKTTHRLNRRRAFFAKLVAALRTPEGVVFRLPVYRQIADITYPNLDVTSGGPAMVEEWLRKSGEWWCSLHNLDNTESPQARRRLEAMSPRLREVGDVAKYRGPRHHYYRFFFNVTAWEIMGPSRVHQAAVPVAWDIENWLRKVRHATGAWPTRVKAVPSDAKMYMQTGDPFYAPPQAVETWGTLGLASPMNHTSVIRLTSGGAAWSTLYSRWRYPDGAILSEHAASALTPAAPSEAPHCTHPDHPDHLDPEDTDV